MPIITFHGIPTQAVEKYYSQVDELATLIGANVANIFFVIDEKKVLNTETSAFITVEWMKRETKEQILVDDLGTFFQPYVSKTAIFFTDINGKFYLNGQKIG
ncbi:uncharacterized protein DUF1904 [Entomoplasma freundtii]|uniref:Uncharacterized protein n=1 Tax=Entomoplasma freundtii TaxID=74700 RepID=A0A2K8NVQ7_9MOLU|nr:DUF1904 family protein [Entomoplasma freundtii]ATZ16713.1 hypothetical protein EFREU_v1c06930 [Entomoplasma freundtii]TDY58120.1 uncharacterized protein DUF1904 [Entomoplasma freundtii]